ncbi:MAG: NAD-dependent epimerase/dehydratase family protein [Actinomycetota bacterium]|nr:NAD-dependent epimerase/dehydratase family protein [Actinomycetota bacterium]
MRILVIGGTSFVGRHIVHHAMSDDHEVTLFNRGVTNPDLFRDAERLVGDRDGDLEPLRGREWDTVIDVCGYVPRVVKKSVDALLGAVGNYTYVSTISVYADFDRPGLDESAPVGNLEDPKVETITAETYGPLKAACEAVVGEGFPDASFVPRPGYVVGPHDHTDRFTYWVVRAAAGGRMLAPGPPEAPIQFIDGRDLGRWIVDMVGRGATGPYNATGPAGHLTWGTLLESCRDLTRGGAELAWADPGWLDERGVELPLWDLEEAVGGSHAMELDCTQAISSGLSFRPAVDTIVDTLESAPGWDEMKTGLRPDEEKKLLEDYDSTAKPGGTE